MELSNTEQFCISCHEMRDNVFEESKQYVHYSNRSGVHATCADCHVPKSWGPKLVRKIKASREIYHKILGTIDTREKFLEHREMLAERVWDSMKATDSRECRNCHDAQYMSSDAQQRRAWRQHETMEENGETCIDCHKGIAHELPEPDEEEFEEMDFTI
jgi:nitrate/TMAO reductase-like tetraheme cytochrome c subunit